MRMSYMVSTSKSSRPVVPASHSVRTRCLCRVEANGSSDSAKLTTKSKEAIRNTLKWGGGRKSGGRVRALDGQGRIKFLVIATYHC